MYKFFFRHFLRSPKNVGAIAPLSQSVATQLVKHLNMRSDATPWRILEVGAGTGNITKALVSNMRDYDSLDIVEIDAECCNLLKTTYVNDKRISVKCMPFLNWHPEAHYDFIVSTLPLNSFAPDIVNNIMNHYKKLGNREAICACSEYIGVGKLNFMFANNETRKIISERRKVLNTFLKNHLLEKNKVFSNFLPCYIYHLKLHPSLQNTAVSA